jgi:hypothetical protein
MTNKIAKTSDSKRKRQKSSPPKQQEEMVVQAAIPFGVKPSLSAKKRIVTNFNNLSQEVLELLQAKYPLGWRNHIFKVNKSNNDSFYAVTLDMPDVSYLIKVDVEIDSRQKLEEDRSIYGGYDDADNDETDEELPSKEDERITEETVDDDN